MENQRNTHEPNEGIMKKHLQVGAIFTVVGIAILCIVVMQMLSCPINGLHIGLGLLGLIMTGYGLSLLNDGLKEYRQLKKMEVEKLAKLKTDYEAEIIQIHNMRELDRIKIFDPSENQKRTFVIPILADLSGGIYAGTLRTDVPIEVMGEKLDFHRMVEGNPDPTMNVSGLPQNPGGAAGKNSGLSIRTGILASGLAHYPNSFVVDKKDINVLVVIIYNASIAGIAGQSVRITNDVSGMKNLTPLDLDILKCEFVPLEVLKPKVYDALFRMAIDELPEFMAKNKP